MQSDIHDWAARKLRELITRLRIQIQLGTPLGYGDHE